MERAILDQYGINYDKGLINCMGDVDFFQTLLSMFLEDDCFARARKAYAAGDYKELFSCVHELKGVSGNAALTGLYEAIVPLVEQLRKGDVDALRVTSLFEAADAAYRRTCKGIELALAS